MKEVELLSIGKGKVAKLGTFPDEVISEGTLGDGFVLNLKDNVLVAPFSGEITVVYPTGHAICMVGDNGVQMMIHIGAETYNIVGLNKTLVKAGDRVETGDKLVKTDVKKLIKRTGSDAIAVVFLNGEKVIDLKNECDVNHLEAMAKLAVA